MWRGKASIAHSRRSGTARSYALALVLFCASGLIALVSGQSLGQLWAGEVSGPAYAPVMALPLAHAEGPRYSASSLLAEASGPEYTPLVSSPGGLVAASEGAGADADRPIVSAFRALNSGGSRPAAPTYGPAAPQALKGEQGPPGPSGGKGPSGAGGGIYEASMGNLSVDTATAEGAWISALTVPVSLARPSKVSVFVSGTIEYRSDQGSVLGLAIGERGRDPERWKEYRSGPGSAGQNVPFALSETLSLPAGRHSVDVLAYNALGGPAVRRADMVVFVSEE